MSMVLCNHCKNEITTTNFVKCYGCKSNFHYSTCSPLAESTYSTMSVEKKLNWRCQICKPRSKSPNNLYQAFVFDENNQQKQLREDDIVEENERPKKYKETFSLSTLNEKLCSVENNLANMRSQMDTNLTQMKSQIDFLVNNSNTSIATNQQLKDDIHAALATITTTVSTLAAQVSELHEKDTQKDKEIKHMNTRINKLEQQMIAKNIEIKNIENKEISPFDVVKTIAASLDVEIKEEEINKAYRLKKKENKIIVEFSSLSKKNELMSKIVRHRVDAKIINSGDNNNSSPKYIYLNDQLTYNNRQLLWIAKTKAHEAKWKFVWVKNGNIFVRKNENSSSIIIKNAADIELISSTI